MSHKTLLAGAAPSLAALLLLLVPSPVGGLQNRPDVLPPPDDSIVGGSYPTPIMLELLDPDVQMVKVILTWKPGTQPLIIFQSTGKVVKSVLEVDGRFPTRSELRQWAIGHYAQVEASGSAGDWERFRQDLAAVTADFGISKGACDNEDDSRRWVKDTCHNDGYAENRSKNVKFQQGDC